MSLIKARFGDWLFLGLFGAAWGTSFPLIKIATSAGYAPLGMIFWQLAISVVVLGAIIFLRGLPLLKTGKGLLFCLGVTLIGTLVPGVFSFISLANLPAGIVSIAIATVPMASLLIALSLRLEKFEPVRMIGISLGVFALLLIAVPEAALPDPNKRWYILLAVIPPILYGLEVNFVALFSPPRANPISTLFQASVIGLVLLTPVVFWRGEFIALGSNIGVAEAALVASGLLHAIAYSGYIWIIGQAGPVFTSQISYFVTGFAVFVSWAMLDERYSGFVWISLILMLLALRLVRPREPGSE